MAAKERIGIIGDGNVGTALTQGLTRAGYEVQAVGKEPGKVAEVARWAEAIVLAVPFSERENALREMGDAFHGWLASKCQRCFPVAASSAAKPPLDSPMNTSPPAVDSTPE